MKRLFFVLALFAGAFSVGDVTGPTTGTLPTNVVSPTTNQCLVYNGTVWVNGSCSAGGGVVTSVSVVSANGFGGSVATPTSTPAITIDTTITGLLEANGTAIAAATAANVYGLWSGSCSSTTYLRGDGACATPVAGSGTVTSVGASSSGSITITGSPVTTSGTMTFNLAALTGDCTTSAGSVAVTCTQTNGTAFGTFATQNYATPPAIGGTTPAAGSFTTLAASSTVSGTGFSAYLASPPAIGGTAAAAGTFTALSSNAGLTLTNAANSYIQTSTGLSLTSGTTGVGRDITVTVNDSSAVDGIIDFANITCTTCTGISNITDWQVGSVSKFRVDTNGNAVAAGGITASNSIAAGSGASFNWTSRAALTSPAAGDVQVGSVNAASPVNQTLSTQGTIGGTTSNGAGANLAIQSGLGTGNATGSTLTLQTPHATSSGTTQQTANTQISLGDNTVGMPNLASSSAATTGTVCWTTSTGNLTVDTTLACLSSTQRVKQNIQPLDEALSEVMKLRPVSYDLRPEFNPKGLGPMVGFVAEEVQKVDPRLVGTDEKGEALGVRYMQYTAMLTKAVQEQQVEITQLRRELSRLNKRH
jgi:hypothetical protein